MRDGLDPQARAIIDSIASELRQLVGSRDGGELLRRVVAIESSVADLATRLDDIETKRSLATMRQEMRSELRGGIWLEVRSSLIRWGIPASIVASGWALAQWVRSIA